MNAWELSPGWAIDVDGELGCAYVRLGQLVIATVRSLETAYDLLEAIEKADPNRVEVRHLAPIPANERLALLAAVKGGLA